MLSDNPFDFTAPIKIEDSLITLCHKCNHSVPSSRKYSKVKASALHSSHQPSDAHLAQIGLLLAEADLDLERSSSLIYRLQKCLSKLQRNRNYLGKCRDQYRAFISPIRRVPVEIWIDIFYECCKDEINGADIDAEDCVPPTAIHLSSVCSLWHNIFSATPTLWSFVTLNLQALMRYPREDTHTRIQQYLRRSQGLPLHVRMIGSQVAESHEMLRDPPNIDITIDLLRHSMNRWKNLHIDRFGLSYINQFIVFKGALPLLETLNFIAERGLIGWRHKLTYFLTFPRLRHISITGDSINITASSVSHESALRSITLTRFQASQIRKILEGCPTITSATLEWPKPYRDSFVHRPVHTNLQYLSIFIDYQDSLDYVLDILTLPRLESLHIETNRATSTPTLSTKDFPPFIARSNCKLRQLSWINARLDGEELLDILRLTPELRALVWEADASTNRDTIHTLLSHLVVSSSSDTSETLLPNLTILGMPIFDDQGDLALDMIESRGSAHVMTTAHTTSVLNLVNLQITSYELTLHASFMKRVAGLRDGGLDLWTATCGRKII